MRTPSLLPFVFVFFLPFLSIAQTNSFSEDFLEFWTDIRDNYAYFDKKQTDWQKVKEIYLPRAQQAKDSWALISVFENALEELYDHHLTLNTNLQTSTRLVPSGSDLWAEYINGKPVIIEARKSFSFGKCEGMEILSINGVAVEEAVKNRIGKCLTKPDTEARNFALRQLLAGDYLSKRDIEVKQGNRIFHLRPDEGSTPQQKTNPLDLRLIDKRTGYIRINNSLGDPGIIPLFDSALLQLKDTRQLILDLRDTPGGGNSLVARGIMGRFIEHEMPYQKHVLQKEEQSSGIKRSWIELVAPRGPFTYSGQLLILVNHWTGSMGEGIAIGFDALKRAKIIGTKMAGLNGAIYGFHTSRTNIPYSIPVERLYHINGTPRENFSPPYLVDPTDAKYSSISDAILFEALQLSK